MLQRIVVKCLPLLVRERRTDMSFEPCLRNFEGRSKRSGESGGVSKSPAHPLPGCRSNGAPSS